MLRTKKGENWSQFSSYTAFKLQNYTFTVSVQMFEVLLDAPVIT